MKRPYFLTIQKKFLLLILLVGLVPAVAGVILTVAGSRLSFAWATANGLEFRARETADRMGLACEDRHARLRALVEDHNGELLRTRLDPLTRELADVLVRYRPGEPPYVLALEGADEPLAEMLRRYEDQFASYFTAGDVPREGFIDDLYLGGAHWNGDTGVILFAYPEAGGGLLIFVSGASGLLGDVRTAPGQDNPIAIYSRKGYMLTSSTLDLDLLPEAGARFQLATGTAPGWFNVIRKEGGLDEWFLVAHAPVPRVARLSAAGTAAPPWIVLLTYDMEIFLGPQATLIWTTAFVALIWALMLTGVSVFMTRRVVGPVKQLRFQAEAMAGGDLDAQAKVSTRDEIQDLAGAFNTMARKLRKSHRDLESRVEESQLRANHIYVINEITKAITQALDLDRTFEILKRELPKILPYDALWIALTDRETGKLRVSHAEPASMIESLRRGTLPLEYDFHGQSLREMKAARGVIGPADDSDPSQSGVFTLLGFRSFLVAPLPSVERALGTITVVSRRDDVYGEEEVDILASVAGAVAVGIEQAELFQRTRRFAEELEIKVHERTRELARATQGLIQAEKYAATGRLGANLAHEINNPLGIIKNYLKLSTDALKRSGGGRRSTDPNLQHLTVIDEEINRIARIVRRLLDLHRPADDNPQRTDIAAMLRDIMTLMEKDLLQHGIRVESDFESDMPHPMVAPDLVRQVYLNLLRNAEDAMENGGLLTITARTVRLGEGDAAQPAISVSIRDTGCGIAEADLKDIFDPFYTTKSPDKGTGLGLYVSYGIVQRYQGTIDVQSTPGQGSTFTVVLPVDPVQQGGGLISTSRLRAADMVRGAQPADVAPGAQS